MRVKIMDEKVRVLTPIQISNLDKDVDITAIWRELNSYVKALSSRINLQDLGEWKLLVSVLSLATNGIGVFKRVRRYPSDKEFEISTVIPIPDNDQAFYGLYKVKDGFYTPLNEKKFYILKPHYENFDNLYDYILESSKCAIDLAFTHGFTCNGKKIKFQRY
jgi:hypothetical protein